MKIFLINLLLISARSQLVKQDFKDIHTYISVVFDNSLNPHWVPDNSRLVTTTPLPMVRAVPRCGEGGSRGIKVCVHYDECDPATKAVKHPEIYEQLGDELDAVDYDEENLETECSNLMDTCCFLYPQNPTTIKSTTIKPTTNTTNPTTFHLTTPTPTTTKNPEISISYCGRRNYEGLNASIIVKKDETQYGEFPWVVAILNTLNESELICSGSLIHPGVILTSAYCVKKYLYKPYELKILAGEWDSLSQQKLYPTQERGVTKIIIHENYNPNTRENNFALIFVEKIFTRAKNLQTICLPLHKQRADSRNCFITEWGQDRFNNRALKSNVLKKLELQIVPRDICQNQFRKNEHGPNYVLPESMVCAGGYSSENCFGDSGTPLICPDPHNKMRYIQVGVLIGGVKCGNGPRVYSNVARARHWIDDKVAVMGYDSITYAR